MTEDADLVIRNWCSIYYLTVFPVNHGVGLSTQKKKEWGNWRGMEKVLNSHCGDEWKTSSVSVGGPLEAGDHEWAMITIFSVVTFLSGSTYFCGCCSEKMPCWIHHWSLQSGYDGRRKSSEDICKRVIIRKVSGTRVIERGKWIPEDVCFIEVKQWGQWIGVLGEDRVTVGKVQKNTKCDKRRISLKEWFCFWYSCWWWSLLGIYYISLNCYEFCSMLW